MTSTKSLCLAAMVLVVCVAPFSWAQVSTVTVNGAGGADFLTIQDAITSFSSGEINSTATPPFTINVVPAGGPYVEQMTLDTNVASGEIMGDLTIQSSVPGTPAEIRLQLGLGATDDGLVCHQHEHSVTFIDLIFCPSLTAPRFVDDMIKVDENVANVIGNTISFISCVFTSTDAAGAPLVTDKASWITAIAAGTYPSFPDAILGSGDVALKMWNDPGEALNYVIEDCVFYYPSHCTQLIVDGRLEDTGTIIDSVAATTLQWNQAWQITHRRGGTVTVQGTDAGAGPANCVAGFTRGWHALYPSVTSVSASADIDGVLLYADSTTLNHSRGISGGATVNILNVDNSIIASNYICMFDTPNNAMTIDNSTWFTIVAAKNVYQDLIGGATGSIVASDCVFGATGGGTLAANRPAGYFTVRYSAVPSNGPNAITPGAASLEATVTFADPVFANTTAPTAADFLDVRNSQYAGLGSGGSNLAGGADFVGDSIPVELAVFSEL